MQRSGFLPISSSPLCIRHNRRAQKASTRETQSGQARPSLSLLSSFSPCILPVSSQAVHTLISQECKADKEHTAFLSLYILGSPSQHRKGEIAQKKQQISTGINNKNPCRHHRGLL